MISKEYSPELNSILYKKMSWMIRYGIGILFLVVLCLFFCTRYLKTSESYTGDVILADKETMKIPGNYHIDKIFLKANDLIYVRFYPKNAAYEKIKISDIFHIELFELKGRIQNLIKITDDYQHPCLLMSVRVIKGKQAYTDIRIDGEILTKGSVFDQLFKFSFRSFRN